jgi:hypothetical protein
MNYRGLSGELTHVYPPLRSKSTLTIALDKYLEMLFVLNDFWVARLSTIDFLMVWKASFALFATLGLELGPIAYSLWAGMAYRQKLKERLVKSLVEPHLPRASHPPFSLSHSYVVVHTEPGSCIGLKVPRCVTCFSVVKGVDSLNLGCFSAALYLQYVLLVHYGVGGHGALFLHVSALCALCVLRLHNK